MCGEVRYEADGRPDYIGHCHCKKCRQHTGAPVVTLVAFWQSKVTFTKGDRKIYNSSPDIKRSFCDSLHFFGLSIFIDHLLPISSHNSCKDIRVQLCVF